MSCRGNLGQLCDPQQIQPLSLTGGLLKCRSMPVFLYSPGVNVIELDDFTSEFNRIQSHIHLTGMNVVLDPLPK